MKKKEILFVPYQVSMWDALESVWQAARQDKTVDCYVMPVPYYDVLADNSLGDCHYDGDKYPDYVPITSYEEYDIEARRPDVIFFHNPYDGSNSVTRVPEKYYSKNLKRCTDLLVYIPYILSEDFGPAEHQCYMMGVLLADRVFVQPGAIYRKYCRIYTRTLWEHGLENALVPAKEKFLPLSSPKYDKISNCTYDFAKLPEKWQQVIQRPDGSKKKVVLYNTVIMILLSDKERYLDKMDQVFDFFRARRDDVALVWRPHPLLFTAIKAMRPQLRDAYINRLDAFRKEGWGIFDDTSEPYMAMAIADAYYGDESSLLTGWRITGKPALMQNVNELGRQADTNPSGERSLWFYKAAAVVDGRLWFASGAYNGLYVLNDTGGRADLAARFEEDLYRPDLYLSMTTCGGKLVFAPFQAEKIAVYDIESDCMTYYPLPQSIDDEKRKQYVYCRAFGSRVVFVGRHTDTKLLILDVERGCLSEDSSTPEEACGVLFGEQLMDRECASDDVNLYILMKYTKTILSYNTDSGNWESIKLKYEPPVGFEGIAVANDMGYVWTKNAVYGFDLQGNMCEICVCDLIDIYDIGICGARLYLFSGDGKIVYVDPEGDTKLVDYDKGGPESTVPGGRKLIHFVSEVDKGALCFISERNALGLLRDGRMIEMIDMFTEGYPEYDAYSIFCRNLKIEGFYYLYDLNHFLEFVLENECEREIRSGEGSIGTKIYKSLKI